ncbi:MAG TPA: lytic transglycosylase domain-containing protein [Candidatus Binatia bacterium]|nr:lytic transglycosylase domain-containing protein [Candidatus Binatia bacterium]
MARAIVLVALCVLLHGVGTANADTFFFRDRAGVTHFTNVPTDRRYKVLIAARTSFSRLVYTQGTAVDGSGFPLPSLALSTRPSRFIDPPEGISQMIVDAAKRYGVDAALVHAVVRAESAFDHLAVSSAGAMGLMQLMPGTAELVGVRNAFHPQENIEGGVYYLRKMLDRFGNNVALALAAYNAGPGAVETYGGIPPYPETQEYLERVFRFRQEYLRSSLERGQIAFASRRGR